MATILTIHKACPSIGLSFMMFGNTRESETTIIEEIHPPASSSNTNTIYTISTSSSTFPPSTVEDPPDLSQHHFHDNGEIYKTATDFTPLHLNRGMKMVLPIEG